MKQLFSKQPSPTVEESYSTKILNNINTFLIHIILIFLAVICVRQLMNISVFATNLNDFSTVFLSIVLEALPFILLGSLVASLIAVFISEDMIARIIPKSKTFGIILASCLGLVFPLCECAIIPIIGR